MSRINNSSWKRTRVNVGLSQLRVDDLKHTFGYPLRDAGVSFEDRQDLLGHKSQRITTHYSTPDINRLLRASETVVSMRDEPSLRLVENPCNSPPEQGISALQSSQVLQGPSANLGSTHPTAVGQTHPTHRPQDGLIAP